MQQHIFQSPTLFALGLVALAACAPTASIDESERDPAPGPIVEFDPANSILPLPSNLVLNPVTGLLALPEQCGESATAALIREQVLNQLDGFGTFKPFLQVTFSEAPDIATVQDSAFLFRVAQRGQPDNPAQATPVPLVAQLSQAVRFDSDCQNPQLVPAAVLVPLVPLDGSSTYAVAITDGVTTADGAPMGNSSTWSLVRQTEAPVVVERDGETVTVTVNRTPFDPNDPAGLATLVGLSDLWSFHNLFLPFVDAALGAQDGDLAGRDKLLVAWSFNTQTVQTPLDVTVPGSPAAVAATATSNATTPVDLATPGEAPELVQDTLCLAQGQGPGCAGVCTGSGGAIPCDAVGFVKGGSFAAPSYQVLRNGIPAAWDDPRAPSQQGDESIAYLGFVPAATAPATGFPTVIFGHGLTRSKNDLFAIASQLAAAGIASIAIDWVAHGPRAKQINTEGDCAGTPDPSTSPQCFAPISSLDLSTTRDNFRQTVLDVLKLVEVLKACGTTNCNDLQVDAARIGYVGQSLGAIMGVTMSASSPDIKAAVLNVGGVGIVDVLIDSETPAIVCPVVDGLIAVGILSGTLWAPDFPADALCLQDSWKADPAFLQFANTSRWILDPSDSANFVFKLATGGTRVLVQEVIGDTVVPNSATAQLGGLLRLTPQPARLNDGTIAPSPALDSDPEQVWITYETKTEGDVTNTYNHGSLAAPAGNDAAGVAGTAQMQTDVIDFFVTHLPVSQE